jgi:hypothetical protein
MTPEVRNYNWWHCDIEGGPVVLGVKRDWPEEMTFLLDVPGQLQCFSGVQPELTFLPTRIHLFTAITVLSIYCLCKCAVLYMHALM